jgi:hypothetical protein
MKSYSLLPGDFGWSNARSHRQISYSFPAMQDTVNGFRSGYPAIIDPSINKATVLKRTLLTELRFSSTSRCALNVAIDKLRSSPPGSKNNGMSLP